MTALVLNTSSIDEGMIRNLQIRMQALPQGAKISQFFTKNERRIISFLEMQHGEVKRAQKISTKAQRQRNVQKNQERKIHNRNVAQEQLLIHQKRQLRRQEAEQISTKYQVSLSDAYRILELTEHGVPMNRRDDVAAAMDYFRSIMGIDDMTARCYHSGSDKIRYETVDKVLRAQTAWNAIAYDRQLFPMRFYVCRRCNGYHLSKMTPQEL